MLSPPTGTVTFMFTDMEGSTRMWERDAEAMRSALARHDEILRSAIEERDGHVFKTVGDAFCAAFSSAPDAVEAALLAQRALRAEKWDEESLIQVRMAIHTGAVEEREGDYFGPPVNRVSRLLSAGHGGQTLLSLATQELVRDALPVDARLEDLGEKRLKDLFRPERVFHLTVPDLPSEFPPLRTLESLRNNLPLQATPLVGREREVEEVCGRLGQEEIRLLTLTGPGGTGKTRLALQAAADLLEDFEDGIYFVPLATVTDPDLFFTEIAGALGLQESGDVSLKDSLQEYLRRRELLLVMDNFEQILSAVPLAEEFEICVRLDGLPLAIELAAARIKLLPPKVLLTRLANRLKLLTGGAKSLPTRQRTLRGAIEWGHDLLDDGERTLFARLSVFSGGRTLEAIEAICDADGDLPVDALDGVSSLLDKSLLLREETSEEESRFVMLETIHEYAREKLLESGEAEEVSRLHAEYFLAFAEEAEPELEGPDQVSWMERLEADLDNFRAALSRLQEAREMFWKLGDWLGVCVADLNLGNLALAQNDFDLAEKQCLKVILGLQERAEVLGIVGALDILASVTASRGEIRRAARIWGGVEGYRDARGIPWPPDEREMIEPRMYAARTRLEEAAWQEEWERGKSMTLDQTVGYALEGVGDRAVEQG